MGGPPTAAGDVTFFGDMGGNLYAVETRTGHVLRHFAIPDAIGGGVITYLAGEQQRVAVVAGYTSILWPLQATTAKIVILGLQ